MRIFRFFLLSLPLLSTSIVGCAKKKIDVGEAVMADDQGMLPIEAAHNAIVAMLADAPADSPVRPGTRELFDQLRTVNYINDLRSSKPRLERQGEVVVIGDWTCDRKRLSFTASFSANYESIVLDGLFRKDDKGNWLATIESATISHKK